jgi:hypothetical protein
MPTLSKGEGGVDIPDMLSIDTQTFTWVKEAEDKSNRTNNWTTEILLMDFSGNSDILPAPSSIPITAGINNHLCSKLVLTYIESPIDTERKMLSKANDCGFNLTLQRSGSLRIDSNPKKNMPELVKRTNGSLTNKLDTKLSTANFGSALILPIILLGILELPCSSKYL